MSMIGADVEEQQGLATSFGDGARELRELAAELTSGIRDAADWQSRALRPGRDARPRPTSPTAHRKLTLPVQSFVPQA
jgi:hypothetical protein